MLNNFPIELQVQKRWIVWVRRGNKTLPLTPRSLSAASSTDPATWGYLDEALRRVEQGMGEGVSFAVGDELTGIDLDWKEAGSQPAWAKEVIAAMGSYTEISPSRQGAHIFLLGSLPAGRGGRRKKMEGGEIEIYSRFRFLRVTDLHLSGTPKQVRLRQTELEQLASRLWPPTPQGTQQGQGLVEGDDAELLERASRSKNGGRLMRLYQGDASEFADASEDGVDLSRADYTLARMLAFWTGPDLPRLERLMRSSRLYRPKWDRGDYLERTLAMALEGRNFYSPRIPRGKDSAGDPPNLPSPDPPANPSSASRRGHVTGYKIADGLDYPPR